MTGTFQLSFVGTLAIQAETPVVTRIKGAGKWRLEKELVIRLFGAKIVVPAGFETDFASCPRAMQWLLSEDAIFSAAAVLHDYLYFKGVDKDLADAVFYAVMKWEELPSWQSFVMWQSVLWFGGVAYRAHRARDVK